MRKTILAAVTVVAFAAGSHLAVADTTVTIQPEVDTWIMEQPADTAVTVDGDIVVGATLPDTVQVIEVPEHDQYSYVVVNKKRVLVDRSSRKVVKIYE